MKINKKILIMSLMLVAGNFIADNYVYGKENKITAQKLHNEAISYKGVQYLLKAKKIYEKIIEDYGDYEKIEAVQKELEDLNLKIIHTSTETPHAVTYVVQNADTLGKIARKHKTTVDLIKKRNGFRSDLIHIGQKLSIWKGKFNIFVDKSQNILILKNDNETIKVYKVSTGFGGSTPVGEFTIVNKLLDPVWFHHGVAVPAGSPDNFLGTRWMGFDKPAFGIHGTHEPELIGKQVSAGCVRMRNEDVEELYGLIPAGTKVVIVD